MSVSFRRVGWFGKLPSAGDFLNRRVESEVRQRLDDWLQLSLAESRNALGSTWLDAFLTSPVWHFVLHGDGGTRPDVAGVMIPSVDRVGRYFPFLTLVEFDGDADLEGIDALLTRIRPDVLSALEDGFDADAFDYRLDAHLRTAQRARALDVEFDRDNAERAFPATTWWTEGSDSRAAGFLRFPDLPAPSAFADLLRDERVDDDLKRLWDATAGIDAHSNGPMTGRWSIASLAVHALAAPAGPDGPIVSAAVLGEDGTSLTVATVAPGVERAARTSRFLGEAVVREGRAGFDRARAFLAGKGTKPDGASALRIHADGTLEALGGFTLRARPEMTHDHPGHLASGGQAFVVPERLRALLDEDALDIMDEPETILAYLRDEALVAGLPAEGPFILIEA